MYQRPGPGASASAVRRCALQRRQGGRLSYPRASHSTHPPPPCCPSSPPTRRATGIGLSSASCAGGGSSLARGGAGRSSGRRRRRWRRCSYRRRAACHRCLPDARSLIFPRSCRADSRQPPSRISGLPGGRAPTAATMWRWQIGERTRSQHPARLRRPFPLPLRGSRLPLLPSPLNRADARLSCG